MSRLPGKTLARRIPAAIAGTAAVVALTAGSAMISAGTAAAEPGGTRRNCRADRAGPQPSPPEASAAVQQLIGTAGADQITTALDLPDIGVTKPQSFMYPAPTVGCGVAGEPVTVTLSSAQAGPNFPLPPWVEADHLRFQAIPGYVGIPKTSGLSVAWINVGTFKGGIVPLDEKLPVLDTPLLSKVVDTGDGKVFCRSVRQCRLRRREDLHRAAKQWALLMLEQSETLAA